MTIQSAITGGEATSKYPVLEDRHRLFICRMIAQMYPLKDAALKTLEEFGDEWGLAGKKIEGEEAAGWLRWIIPLIKYYKDHPHAARWQAEVERIREEWLGAIGAAVRERHKTARIEEYAGVYREAREAGDFAQANKALRNIAEEVNELPTRDGSVNVRINNRIGADQRRAFVTVEQLGEPDRDKLLKRLLDREEANAGAEEAANPGQPAALPAGAT